MILKDFLPLDFMKVFREPFHDLIKWNIGGKVLKFIKNMLYTYIRQKQWVHLRYNVSEHLSFLEAQSSTVTSTFD